MSLYTADVAVENVVTTDPEKAKALENDVRAKSVDMLAGEEYVLRELLDRTLTKLSEEGELDQLLG